MREPWKIPYRFSDNTRLASVASFADSPGGRLQAVVLVDARRAGRLQDFAGAGYFAGGAMDDDEVLGRA